MGTLMSTDFVNCTRRRLSQRVPAPPPLHPPRNPNPVQSVVPSRTTTQSDEGTGGAMHAFRQLTSMSSRSPACIAASSSPLVRSGDGVPSRPSSGESAVAAPRSCSCKPCNRVTLEHKQWLEEEQAGLVKGLGSPTETQGRAQTKESMCLRRWAVADHRSHVLGPHKLHLLPRNTEQSATRKAPSQKIARHDWKRDRAFWSCWAQTLPQMPLFFIRTVSSCARVFSFLTAR